MKKFRKLLVLSFSAFLTVGAIAGCNDDTDTTPTDSESVDQPSDSVSNTDTDEVSDSEPDTPTVSDSEPDVPPAGYNAALDIKEYLEESYKDTTSKMANFELPTTQNTYDNQDNPLTVTISWELDVAAGGVEGAIVKGDVVDGKQTFQVKYDAETSLVATNFTITGTIEDPNGNSETITFEWSIPAFEFTSFDDFAQLAKDKSDKVVNVAGTVVAVYKDGLYFENADGDGFYAYRPTDFVATEYSVGDQILVSGTATSYNSQYEFSSGCTLKLISEAPDGYTPTYEDVTAAFLAAESKSDADAFDAYQNSLVEVKGVTIGTFSAEKDSQLYYYFEIGNVVTYLRPYSGWYNPDTNAPYTADEINSLVSEWVKGYTADLKGVLSIYGGAYYLSLVDNDAITYTSKELPDDVKAANSAEVAADEFKDTYLMGHTFDLPTTGQNDAALSYNINSEAAKIDENGDLVITPLATDTTVSVEITAVVNGQSGTYTTDFVVKGTDYTTIDAAKAVELAGALDGSKNQISTEWYYVSATVGEVYNTGYCNFYLTTEDNAQALIVYGLWTGEDSGENRYGSNREIAEIPVAAGDQVVLYTQLQNYGGKLECVNARLISVGAPVVEPEATLTMTGTAPADFVLNENGVFEATFTLAQWGNVTFTYTDVQGNATVLNHHNTTITGLVRAKGEYGCDWSTNLYHDDAAMETAGQFYSYGGTYYATYDPATSTLNITDTPVVDEPENPTPDAPVATPVTETFNWTNGLGTISSDSKTLTIDCGNFVMTLYQNTSSSSPKNTYDQVRVYQDHIFTITAKDGYDILGWSFTDVGGKNPTSIDLSVDENAALLSYTAESNVWTVTASQALESIAVKTTKQMRFTSIEVTIVEDSTETAE